VALFNQYAGRQDLRTASALNSLGWFYNTSGRPNEASVTMRKAWTIVQQVLPDDSPELLMFLDSEASLLCQRNCFRESEKDWLRALTIGEKAYGNDVQRYSGILTHLGELYSSLGDYESAAGFLKRSLAAYEQPGNAESIANAIIMSELANVCTKSKRYSEAEPLFSRSIEIVNQDRNSAPLGKAIVLTRAGDYYMTRHD